MIYKKIVALILLVSFILTAILPGHACRLTNKVENFTLRPPTREDKSLIQSGENVAWLNGAGDKISIIHKLEELASIREIKSGEDLKKIADKIIKEGFNQLVNKLKKEYKEDYLSLIFQIFYHLSYPEENEKIFIKALYKAKIEQNYRLSLKEIAKEAGLDRSILRYFDYEILAYLGLIIYDGKAKNKRLTSINQGRFVELFGKTWLLSENMAQPDSVAKKVLTPGRESINHVDPEIKWTDPELVILREKHPLNWPEVEAKYWLIKSKFGEKSSKLPDFWIKQLALNYSNSWEGICENYFKIIDNRSEIPPTEAMRFAIYSQGRRAALKGLWEDILQIKLNDQSAKTKLIGILEKHRDMEIGSRNLSVKISQVVKKLTGVEQTEIDLLLFQIKRYPSRLEKLLVELTVGGEQKKLARNNFATILIMATLVLGLVLPASAESKEVTPAKDRKIKNNGPKVLFRAGTKEKIIALWEGLSEYFGAKEPFNNVAAFKKVYQGLLDSNKSVREMADFLGISTAYWSDFKTTILTTGGVSKEILSLLENNNKIYFFEMISKNKYGCRSIALILFEYWKTIEIKDGFVYLNRKNFEDFYSTNKVKPPAIIKPIVPENQPMYNFVLPLGYIFYYGINNWVDGVTFGLLTIVSLAVTAQAETRPVKFPRILDTEYLKTIPEAV